MTYKDVLKDLKNDCLDNLYLFYGKEYYLIENTIDKIKQKMIDKAFEDLNFQFIDGKETNVDMIINACETLPFMGEKRMVLIKDLECFFGKRKNISDQEEESLIKYFGNIPSTTHLFFIVTNEIDKRKKIIKMINKYGKVVEFDKLVEKDIYKWIERTFAKYNKQVRKQEISFFLDITGYLEKNSTKSLKDLDNEINKLCSYVGDRNLITTQDIELLAPKSIENNIFSLVESIGTKNSEKALSILSDMLMEGESEIKILYMITRQFRYLFQIKLMEKQGYTPVAIGPKLGLKQFVVKKYLKQALNFNVDILKKALEQCLLTDESIKKGRIDQRMAIELLIAQFAK
ncbi:DNA polymerase III subunit delta [Crassaminicella thermophila]|uniref:DNA polymerase III subunit delta n=1 Tax=Crassaminicella thermophila TaxID=2599308 RepID=A0A5C0SGM8_CRATE|nr:DNA polymerase III subunit delta [Crassaminicella thermophila]QEK12378.1 DNA polymerase III subunit delta [Crassaminicella thermophila]